jgi:hypothetical protein
MTTDQAQVLTPEEAVLATLLAECRQRDVWFEMVVELVARYCGREDHRETRRLTLEMVRQLMGRQGMRAWNYNLISFEFTIVPWDPPIKCALDRIDYEWLALGRDPGLGEIVCFTIPNRVG